MEKIDELIAQQLGQIISVDIELPIGSLATITKVKTSADLKQAKIFLSIWPESKQREIMSLLINSLPKIQSALNNRLTLRNIPKLRFIIDETGQDVAKLDQLLKELK
ncbi:MAG: ribosome-binding factor A [Candidatus Buchananbacteria bacterium RIFCSPHIGHO2_02_FULL_40_13]|uniref:Ribosome-binding factor A n=1 Tax=Candidatus Buchananbacteria bacterium RIFCSPLOWO2_01_FULL_39_33 TaxID=1797543 RepID=A0A1G1YH65_9BACT|nr:MAG: ribosome-binding factor A [Candidatus Buchananbacteria bacterium RIFCSPHIGHO2_01_FULL_40_35]OGY49493.1 MAG: ribosome-binding factor A [Candidatus Buchananbacteria bacterium RIFCSPHIGHO2_02_FULL_40_13]OGY51708.1 MAG: ribosome-binding factor A [Candidatus Buchananbacteria bacterium RIFCSPLOWO2_01_FULL_39_33]